MFPKVFYGHTKFGNESYAFFLNRADTFTGTQVTLLNIIVSNTHGLNHIVEYTVLTRPQSPNYSWIDRKQSDSIRLSLYYKS